MLPTAVRKALTKRIQCAFYYLAVQEAIHKFVLELQSVDAVTTKIIDFPPFTVSVARFIKHNVAKCLLDMAKMEEQFRTIAEAVDQRKIKIVERILTEIIDSVRSQRPPKDISYENKPVPSRTVQQSLRMGRNLAVTTLIASRERAGAIVLTVFPVPRRCR